MLSILQAQKIRTLNISLCNWVYRISPNDRPGTVLVNSVKCILQTWLKLNTLKISVYNINYIK